MSSYEYDPFAPQGSTDEQGDINGIPEAFEDEVAVLMGMDATPSKSESNDPFSLDLLTGSPTADFIYEDKEDDDSPTKVAVVSQENNNTDDFVDDDDDDGEKGRGFLSRLKNKIPEGMTTGDAATASSNIHTDTNADYPAKQANGGGLEDGGNSLHNPETGATRWWVLDESDSDSDEESEDGLDDNGESLPHPDEVLRTKKKKNKEKDEITEAANQTLDGNGNSLPHPDEVLRTKRKKNKDKDEIRKAANQVLDGNGNSLPHPDEVLRTKRKKNKDKDEIRKAANQVLDKNGNSLPHPDEVLRTKKKKKKKKDKDEIREVANQMLDENGNSLPHPDEILRTPGTPMANANTTDEILEAANLMLDEGGNSLPHPETLMRGGNHNPTMEWDDSEVVMSLNDTTTPFLHDNDTSNSTSNNDNDQLLAALDAASESSDSEDDYYVNDTDDSDDVSNSNSNSDSDASRKELDENGNSLPHPETMFPNGSSNGSGNKIPSLRWGNLRTSLKSTFSKNTDDSKEPRSENENDGFSDEEQVNFTGSPSQRNYTDTNNTNDSFLDLNDNGNSLPNPETIFEENQRPKRKSALQLIQEVRKSALRSISSRHTNNTATPENDEERAYGRDNPYTIEVDVDSAADPDDHDFNDESNCVPQSKKERLQTLLQEHRDKPRSRKICFLLVVIFVLFLALVIPLSTRNKAKNIGSDGKDSDGKDPTTLPPALNLGSCDDEIVMTDNEGRDFKTDDADPAAPCYTTEEPIFFRFKRCRPASPLDWVGVYPEGSIFLDRLWKKFYDGVYLCGGQPCPIEDPMNIKGASPRAQTTAAPPITSPGQYRFFLVKDSDWPYEYLKYTPSFQVVKDKTSCPSSTNNSAAADVSSPTALDELQQGIFVNVDLGTTSPTAAPTSAPTKTFAPTATFAPTYYPTTLQTSTGTAFSF